MISGRVQFGIGNADDVLLFRQQDANVVALMAPILNTPRCVLVREDSGIKSLDGLKGVILQANQGQPFVDYMKSKGMLEGVQSFRIPERSPSWSATRTRPSRPIRLASR